SADSAEAIRYAAHLSNASGLLPAKRADVVNMSYGAYGFSQVEANAVAAARAAGCVLVAAAGNDGLTIPLYPAGYSGVIAVAATNYVRGRASYSNYGPWVTVAAPGGDSSVDLNGDGYGDGILVAGWNGSTPDVRFLDGTSFAAPMVTGTVAL